MGFGSITGFNGHLQIITTSNKKISQIYTVYILCNFNHWTSAERPKIIDVFPFHVRRETDPVSDMMCFSLFSNSVIPSHTCHCHNYLEATLFTLNEKLVVLFNFR
jgi:hypothetical protein